MQFSLLAILFLPYRTMIETPKEFQNTQTNSQPTAEKNVPPKTVDPLAQDIIEQFVKINGQKSEKVYKKLSMLGKGGFAECFLTKQKDTDRKAATKVIPKKLLDSHRTKIRLSNEIKLHKSLRHEHVVEFYNTFEDDQNVYINLEVCEYGSINDLLRARYSFKVPEVQSFLHGICHGLRYLHSRNIIHRDLKLGNLFLNSQLQVKIGDFGLACKLQFAREFKRTVCGTPNYIAPQILEGKGYHFQIDIWSLGVIIYTLFFTIPPFQTDQPHTTYQKIRKCDYEFPKNHEVPPEGIDLIKKLLVQNPADRLTIDQILQSPFMKMGGSIPLGLPACCLKRPPTKRELSNWPKLLTVKQAEFKQMNSTMLGFLGISKKSDKLIYEKNQINQGSKQKEQADTPIFCKTVQQSEEEAVVFYLNNGNFGVYDLATSQVYSSQIRQKSEKQIELIKKSSLNESGSLKEQQVDWTECRHKILMNIKYKALLQEKVQVGIPETMEKSTNVSKIHTYKDVIMLRLTNRAIQVIYKQRDGFLLSPNRKCLLYFYSFKDTENGKEVDLSSALGAGLNDKQNRLNSSGQFSISSIFKQKKICKHLLTMKKIAYLKGILSETVGKNNRKN